MCLQESTSERRLREQDLFGRIKEPSEGSDETELFEEDKTAVTPPPPRQRRARLSIRPQILMATSTKALIDAFAAGSPPLPLPPTSPAYDQAPLDHRAAMIRMRDDIPKPDMPPRRRFVFTAPPPGCDVAEIYAVAAARPPRGQYDFVDTAEAGQGLICSPGHDAQTIAKSTNRAEDVSYVRALQASEHRMMTSIEEVNLRVSYQAQNHACNKIKEGKRCHDSESIQALMIGKSMKYSTHTQDDASQRSGGGLKRPGEHVTCLFLHRFHEMQPLNSKELSAVGCAALTWWIGYVRTLGHDGCLCYDLGDFQEELYSGYQRTSCCAPNFLLVETEKDCTVISGLLDNNNGNVCLPRPKTLDDALELGNDTKEEGDDSQETITTSQRSKM
ncbi:hypothetical protein Tco_1523123 [Tanacetum coccineum]